MKNRILIAALALAAGTSSALADARHDAAETARNLEILREALTRWEGGEPVFGVLLADELVLTIPGSGPVARTYHGKADCSEQPIGGTADMRLVEKGVKDHQKVQIERA